MKLRNEFLIKTVGLLGAAVVSRLMATVDFRTDFGPWGAHPMDPRRQRCIYTFWHDSLIAPTTFRSKTRILISNHADGELIAQVVRHLGFGVVRGSSTRNGASALLEMIRLSTDWHLCVTPDGPRGPRRKAQAGAVYLASQTGLPIVPGGVAYANAWRARSWDRFAVPLPYSQIYGVCVEPLRVPPNLDAKGIAHYLQILQERLDQANDMAERWMKGLRRRGTGHVTIPLAKSA